MRPTSPLWYLAALLLALAGWVLAVAVAAGDWDPLREADVTAVSHKVRSDVGRGRLAAYTDTLQPDRKVRCAGRRDGRRVLDLTEPGVDVSTVDAGITWHLVAITEDSVDRAGLRIRCRMTDDALDTAAYGFALIPGADATRHGTGIGIGATGLAIALAGWTFVVRLRRTPAEPSLTEPTPS